MAAIDVNCETDVPAEIDVFYPAGTLQGNAALRNMEGTVTYTQSDDEANRVFADSDGEFARSPTDTNANCCGILLGS